MKTSRHDAYLERVKEEERIRREAQAKYTKEMREYVDKKMTKMRRKAILRAREDERKEEDRLARRIADRVERRDARIARQEARERVLMSWEDELSSRMRDDDIERAIMVAHQLAM